MIDPTTEQLDRMVGLIAPANPPAVLAQQFAAASRGAATTPGTMARLERISLHQHLAAVDAARNGTAPALGGTLRVQGETVWIETRGREKISLRFPALRDASPAQARAHAATLNTVRGKRVEMNAALWADAQGLHAEVVGLKIKKIQVVK